MSTAERDRRVKRVCKIRPNGSDICGKVYYVEKGSRSKGCPECCPRLDVGNRKAS